MDANAIQRRLGGAVPARLGGGVLIGFGILFLFRALGAILNSSTRPTEFAVAVADLVITPAWITGGVMLWCRNAWGYVVGLGLLFQASLLFIGLCLFLLLQPFLTTAPFVLTDIVVILVMGFACFILFGLYERGVTSRETQGEY